MLRRFHPSTFLPPVVRTSSSCFSSPLMLTNRTSLLATLPLTSPHFKSTTSTNKKSSKTSTTTTKEEVPLSAAQLEASLSSSKPSHTHTIVETNEGGDSNTASGSAPQNKGIAGQEDTPEEITSFLNQFQYGGAELGLKLSPPDLAVDLLEYQKEGIGWMVRREHFHSGGILADFLGMGKTLQILALCCARHENPRLIAEKKKNKKKNASKGKSTGEDDSSSDSNNNEVTKAIQEQQKKIDKASFTTHGEPFRLQTVIQQLIQIPAVNNVSKITRPGKDLHVLDADLQDVVRRYGSVSEEATENRVAAIRKELDKWLRFAGKYYATWEQRARMFLADGTTMSREKTNESSKAESFDMNTPEMRTLIIVPASLAFQWKHEIESKIDQSKRPCKILIYHGSNTKHDKFTPIDLETYDFVITTYESVVRGCKGAFKVGDSISRKRTSFTQESMGAQMFNRSAAGPLFKVRWKRIILDEAHYVRNERTTRFKCIKHLMGVKRWAVTATPLHNTIQDLQTLLSFVGQPKLPLFEANESLLLKDPVLQRAIARSLQPAFLRRTPVMTRHGVEQTLLVLPSKDDQVVRGDLTQKEVLLYNDALTKRQNALSMVQGKGFIHVFAMMTLLRQACCHPWMTEGKKSDHQVCYICNLETLNPLIARCGHAFCKECLNMAFKSQSGDREDERVRLPCPACQVPIPISIFTEGSHKATSVETIAKLRKRKWVSSTKMDMLMSSIRQITRNQSDEKVVVFAQFTSLLDIVTIALENNFEDLGFVRIDGSMSLKARNGLIHSFTYQKDVKVLLASKMAMGVGLNLTAANHVIILDPWWNPQVEEQAVHRCHRIGQKKHVTVQRFVMNDTIEQYCYEISRKKKDFGDAVLHAATADDDGDHQTGAKTIAQMIARDGVKPILVTSGIQKQDSSSSSNSGTNKGSESKDVFA